MENDQPSTPIPVGDVRDEPEGECGVQTDAPEGTTTKSIAEEMQGIQLSSSVPTTSHFHASDVDMDVEVEEIVVTVDVESIMRNPSG